ncbi:MAG: class I SAM-dependent methyltransferase [Flavobacterium sp.]|nr:class I SAM-dependent methyltransferase [Flavobacterium sp.]
MTINQLLQPEIQNYIYKNENEAISKLALQKNPFPDFDYKAIINQIECRAKAKSKLPTWFNTKNIIYPSKISVEQTSSEKTANYKAQLVSGKTLIDLTGGFGVDVSYFAKTVSQVTHCESDANLSAIVAHNFKQLQISNTICIAGDSTEILKKLGQKFETIYIDPSRRNKSKGKVFMLQDCLPNVVELLDFYFLYTHKILIKTAPILDIKAGLLELKNVKNIHIIAVENEVKELLWELEHNYQNSITIKTGNYSKLKLETFDFDLNSNATSTFGLPKKYLYEPNNAIMKSGGFVDIGNHFGLEKLHQHSHLYTSNSILNFPGRVFEIMKEIQFSKKELKEHLENKKINITIRNFPNTVENIRKKFKIKEGSNDYCFFTTDKNENKIVLICKKI